MKVYIIITKTSTSKYQIVETIGIHDIAMGHGILFDLMCQSFIYGIMYSFMLVIIIVS